MIRLDKYIGGYQPTTESKTKPPNTGSSVIHIPKFKKRQFVKVFTCDCVEEIAEKINDFCYENNATPVDVKINFPPEGSFILATTILEGIEIISD